MLIKKFSLNQLTIRTFTVFWLAFFAMTALFIVIAVDQWKTYRSHLPALLGCGITVLSLVILRPDAMLIPALCVIIVALLLLRARLEGSRTEAEEEVV